MMEAWLAPMPRELVPSHPYFPHAITRSKGGQPISKGPVAQT
jgi:hypothetical protein